MAPKAKIQAKGKAKAKVVPQPKAALVRAGGRMVDPAALERAASVFRAWDRNRDGYISLAELHGVMLSLDKEWPPEDLDLLFDQVDKDHNGLIDYEEFVAWCFAPTGDEGKKSLRSSLGEATSIAPTADITVLEDVDQVVQAVCASISIRNCKHAFYVAQRDIVRFNRGPVDVFKYSMDALHLLMSHPLLPVRQEDGVINRIQATFIESSFNFVTRRYLGDINFIDNVLDFFLTQRHTINDETLELLEPYVRFDPDPSKHWGPWPFRVIDPHYIRQTGSVVATGIACIAVNLVYDRQHRQH